jgi:PPOX class probable F420-dependent enzyme
MTVTLPDSAKALITSGQLAHFTTIQADGRPHTTVVWVDLDDAGDEIVIAKLQPDQKLKNIARDPRVSLSIEAVEGDFLGMRNYLVVEGEAYVTEGGAPALLREHGKRYIGPDAEFPPMPNPPEGFLIHVRPTKVRGTGPWSPR